MPLYGHELSEEIDPFVAGLGFAVKLKKTDFIGRAALVERKSSVAQKRVGLILDGRRIAREGSTIHHNAAQVGEVTSGTFSPTLEKSIVMAYVTPEHSTTGVPLEIDIRGKRVAATVTEIPFYRRKS